MCIRDSGNSSEINNITGTPPSVVKLTITKTTVSNMPYLLPDELAPNRYWYALPHSPCNSLP